MKQVQDAYIVAATRTPIGRSHRGFFRNMRPDDLLVKAIQGALAQVPTLDPRSIEDLICGCAIPEGAQGLNVARIGAVLAGLPNSVGGITVNRFCASGLSAIQMAADRIRVGEADVMLAAGVESMTMVPMMGNSPSLSPLMFEHDENIGIAYGMGVTAEKVANRWKVSREKQDEFAVQSHAKAVAAMKAGDFSAEITPIEVTDRSPDLETGSVTAVKRIVSLDEGARPDTSMEGLSKLKAVFAARGSVTAGNRLADIGWCRRLDIGERKGSAAVRPQTPGAFCKFCEQRRAAPHHGHRPDRGDSCRAAIRRPQAG